MSSNVVRELITILGFDLNETGFKRAEKGFKDLKALAGEVVDRVADVGKALFAMSEEVGEAGYEASKTAIKLGTTAEQAQQLAYAFGHGTTVVAGFQSAFYQLNRRAQEAVFGNKQMIQSFGRLGVAFKDVHGKARPTMDLFTSVVSKFKELNNSERDAYAFRLFGRGAQTIIPYITEGSDSILEMMERAKALGHIISEEDTIKSKAFVFALKDMQLATLGVSRRIGLALIPTFQRLIESQTDFLVKNRELIDKGIKALANVVDFLAYRFQHWKNAMFELGTAFVHIFNPMEQGMGRLLLLVGAVAAAFVAAGAGPLLLAFLVGLVIDDIVAYCENGKSAIGRLFDKFLTPDGIKDPKAFWMVRTLEYALAGVRNMIEGYKELVNLLSGKSVGNDWSVSDFRYSVDQMIKDKLGKDHPFLEKFINDRGDGRGMWAPGLGTDFASAGKNSYSGGRSDLPAYNNPAAKAAFFEKVDQDIVININPTTTGAGTADAGVTVEKGGQGVLDHRPGQFKQYRFKGR